MLPFRLLVITRAETPIDHYLDLVEQVSDSRMAFLLRERQSDAATQVARANALLSAGAHVQISGRVDIAAAAKCGVHLPEQGISPRDARKLLPDAVIGASRHDSEGIERDQSYLDYATLSPFGNVPGKNPPLGPAKVHAISQLSEIPLLALGGISSNNANAALRAGAFGLAFIRLAHEEDAASTISALLQKMA